MLKNKFEIKTFHIENLTAISILLIVWILTGYEPIEMIGVFSVFCGFCHNSISERYRERQAIKENPEVECHKMSNVFLLAKEIGWIIYFILKHAWAPLAGCALFTVYPFWRKLWRHYHPMR